MGRQPSWAISSNVRWAWRLSRRLIWLQSFWSSDIYSSPKFLLFGGTSLFSCMLVFLFLDFPLIPPSLPFSCSLPVTLSPPSPFPFHPASLNLIIFLSLSFPFLSWEASKILPFAHYNLSFLSQTRLLYIVPQKHWSAIHDQNLSRSAWGMWSLLDSYRIQKALPLRLYFTVQLNCRAEVSHE